jgi:tetratricopeptide (TPR) repeat protein
MVRPLSDRRSVDRPDSLDPLEMALDAQPTEASADGPAHVLMAKHALLADADLKHRRLQINSERAGLAVKVLGALAGLVLAGLVGLLLWDAAHTDGLVIDAFSVPPDLAQQGLTGQELAAEIEDRLNSLQAQTASSRAPESFSNAWGRDISVQIPQTGVSIGDIQHLLRQWLGHETHVSGALYHTAQGLRLVVRLPSQPADSLDGAAGGADDLVKRAGEALYGRTQPYRYGIYLLENGRPEQARQVLTARSLSGDRRERAWALEGLSSFMPDPRASASGLRQAIEVYPNLALAWHNLGSAEQSLGQSETALGAARRTLLLLQRPDRGEVAANIAPILIDNNRIAVDALLGDFPGVNRALAHLDSLPDFYGVHALSTPIHAQSAAALHDAAAARRWVAQAGRDDAALNRQILQLITGSAGLVSGLTNPHATVAQALEDWPETLRQSEGLEALITPAVRANPQTAALAAQDRWTIWPPHAEAMAHMGRLPEAQALIAQTPLDCEPCLRTRGRIAAFAHDWAGANHWFGETVRQNPSIPFAYVEWGRSLLARGRPGEAIVKFQQAIQKGPHFADPVEGWGEALLASGDAGGALAKFEAVDRMAPLWGRNHLIWGEALAKLGRVAEARSHWLAARGMDLPASDRVRLGADLKAAA